MAVAVYLKTAVCIFGKTSSAPSKGKNWPLGDALPRSAQLSYTSKYPALGSPLVPSVPAGDS